LGRAIGVDATAISAWERGEARPPRSKLRRIALALGWSVDEVTDNPLSEHKADLWLCECRRDLVESGWPGPPTEDWAVGLFR
jgi:transcriptional regulator with XRE-family HTH domain